MKPIDGDKLMRSLADWWYSSFGREETEESKAIKTVMDKIEQSLGFFALEEQSCETCKHGKFGDEACINCRVGFPSHYEERGGRIMKCEDCPYAEWDCVGEHWFICGCMGECEEDEAEEET